MKAVLVKKISWLGSLREMKIGAFLKVPAIHESNVRTATCKLKRIENLEFKVSKKNNELTITRIK